MATIIRPKPNCRPQEVVGYFSRLNRWRRLNGLKPYTSINRFYTLGKSFVVFGHKRRKVPGVPSRD